MRRGIRAARERYLWWSIVVFLGLLVLAAAVLPHLVSGGAYLRDPVVWTVAFAIPFYGWLLWRLPSLAPERAGAWFVGATVVVAWIFTILIQGSGYLVGNYAYLSVVVLFAAFFLDAKKTAAVAAVNIAGVIAIHTLWGLSTRDLALSLTYLVIFSTMLVLIAAMIQDDARVVREHARQLQGVNRDLQRMNDENRILLDNTEDAILHLDPEGRLCSMNRRGREMAAKHFGLVPCQGERLPDLLDVGHAQTAEAWLEDVADGKRPEGEFALQCAEGRLVLRIRLVQAEGGGLVLVATDVTSERRRQEEERRRIAKEVELEKLEEVHRLQRDFINIASHELQTPLTPMRLQFHLLRDKQTGPLNRDQLHAVDVLERNAMRLGRLVDDILQVLRIDEHQLRLKVGDVEMAGIVAEVVARCMDDAQGRRVALHQHGDATAWVRGDADKLAEVVRHLIENGLKFTPSGGRVDVTIAHRGQHLVLDVEDTGIGVPEDPADLFHPFRQVRTAEMRMGGTGLGLAIAKGLVEAHEGSIEAHRLSERGGSHFRVRLPLAGFDRRASRPPRTADATAP